MAWSSSSSYLSGAVEHARTGASEHDAWNGCLAFSNIGLSGEAIRGSRWQKHRKRVFNIVVKLLTTKRLLGVLLNEVGNLSDLLDPKSKEKFTNMILHAFQEAGYEEPTIFWSNGETMAAFRHGVTVNYLAPLTNMKRVHRWRIVERFELIGATRQGECKMLVFNTHQPSSSGRSFPASMRVDFCKACIEDALRLHGDDSTKCGWVFGGDANCSIAPWTMAFRQVPQFGLIFHDASFISGINKKGGDLMVAAAVKGGDMRFFENTCAVKGRETQHDCMFLEWCYRARGTPLPAKKPYPETHEQRKRPRLQEPSTTLGAAEHINPRQEGPSKTPWKEKPAEFWSELDSRIMAAVELGWPQWQFDRLKGNTPPRSPFSLEMGRLKYAARIDMFRGTDADDLGNHEWAAILRRLPKYQSLSMKTYGWWDGMQPPVPNGSWGNCMEKIVGLAYTVSRNQENLRPRGGQLVFPSSQASLAWEATWPFWKSLGLTPAVEVARLQEERVTNVL